MTAANHMRGVVPVHPNYVRRGSTTRAHAAQESRWAFRSWAKNAASALAEARRDTWMAPRYLANAAEWWGVALGYAAQRRRELSST